MMEVEVTKTKEDDLKSGSVVRCLLYDARGRTMHDKNAEVPNMGLSHMASDADIRHQIWTMSDRNFMLPSGNNLVQFQSHYIHFMYPLTTSDE